MSPQEFQLCEEIARLREENARLVRDRDEARTVNMAGYTEAGWSRAKEVESERDDAQRQLLELRALLDALLT